MTRRPRQKGVTTAVASGWLSAFWAICFSAALGIPTVLAIRHAIGWDSMLESADALSGAYIPHFGAILAYYFVARVASAKAPRTSGVAVGIAFTVSAIWNGLVLVLLSQVLFSRLGIEDALKYVSHTGAKLSWMVAPAIGYFFAKSESPGKSAD